jgi:hypothetical protein
VLGLIVIRLEQAFGEDPFATRTILEFRTIGDLAVRYA